MPAELTSSHRVKHQYFGDVNDYLKYGLLRALIGTGLSCAICWMLTPDEGRGDGSLTHYLRRPAEWRKPDPALFDFLQETLLSRNRDLRCIEESGLLSSALFYSPFLSLNARERRDYFHAFWQSAAGCDLVFFDPDNGLEVSSVPCGAQGSNRYLYWDEVVSTFSRGHSMVIYQHFPRQKRDTFIQNIAWQLRKQTYAPLVASFGTKHNVLFLVGHSLHFSSLKSAVANIQHHWLHHVITNIHFE